MKKLKNIFIGIIFSFIVFFLFSSHALAKTVNVYVFHGKTCPHCEEALSYLNSVKDKYDLNIVKYEVWYNADNYKLMKEMADYLDVSATGVPFVVIDNTPIFGYSEGTTDDTYRYHINLAKKDNFVDKVGVKLGIVPAEELKKLDDKKNNNYSLNLPFKGMVDFKNSSLLLSSLVLGIIDGINPGTIWITIFLIVLLIGIKEDKKVWKLALLFIISSAFVYLLFMTSLLSFEKVANYITLIRVLISLFAILIGSIKLNFFINLIDDKKENNESKIKKVFNNNKFLLSVIGIVLLGVITTLIKYSCATLASSLFTNLLALNNLSGISYWLYIIIYIISFMIIHIFIFLLAFILIKLSKINSKYYKYANLISGLLMLLIGILILAKPEWLMFN